MKKIIKNKKKGLLIWITGYSGSGKTSIAKKIFNDVNNRLGQTIEISGDELRKSFGFSNFDRKNRLSYAMGYSRFCKTLTDKKFNVIFSTVSLFHKVQKWNKTNIDNYLEIFIETDLNQLIKKRKKIFYKKKFKNIVGKNIKPQLPKKPHIKIVNNFSNSIDKISKNLFKKIKNNYL